MLTHPPKAAEKGARRWWRTLKEVDQMQTCMVPAGADGPVDENFRKFTARLQVQSHTLRNKGNKKQNKTILRKLS